MCPWFNMDISELVRAKKWATKVIKGLEQGLQYLANLKHVQVVRNCNSKKTHKLHYGAFCLETLIVAITKHCSKRRKNPPSAKMQLCHKAVNKYHLVHLSTWIFK